MVRKLLSKTNARWIAAVIAKLPELMPGDQKTKRGRRLRKSNHNLLRCSAFC
jgi:hypothetical protein